MQALEAVASEYPDTTLGDDWASDEDALRSCAVSTCTNAWGLVYSQLFDGLKDEGGTEWRQQQPH